MNPVKINRVLGETPGGGAKSVLLTFNKGYLYAASNLILTLNKYNEGLFYYIFFDKADDESVKYLFSLGAKIKLYDCEAKFETGTDKYPAICAFRLFAPYLIEDDIEKLLYLDDDMVCKGNIEELFTMDMGNCTIAMAPEVYGNTFYDSPLFQPSDLYCNAGVTVIDMKRYKNNQSYKDLYESFSSLIKDLKFFDQDFLNYYFHGQIHFIKPKYNLVQYEQKGSYYYSDILDRAKIVHFIKKPWDYKTKFSTKKLFLKLSLDKNIKKEVNKALLKSQFHFVLFLFYQPFKLIKPLRSLKERLVKSK